jgi:hypothetical protein
MNDEGLADINRWPLSCLCVRLVYERRTKGTAGDSAGWLAAHARGPAKV